MTTETEAVVELSSTVTAETDERGTLALWREGGHGAPVRIGLTERAEARLLEVLLARRDRVAGK